MSPFHSSCSLAAFPHFIPSHTLTLTLTLTPIPTPRNFLLAKRILKSLNCTPQSWPPLPDTSTHPLWQAWDLATESCLSHVVYMQRGVAMVEPKNNMPFFYCTCKLCKTHGQQHTQQLMSQQSGSQNSFFADQLTAFEVWLDFSRRSSSEQPTHLPILLQVLLSQTHRLRALQLLRRYLLLGKSAVNLALLVGIFPYILKLLQSPAQDIRQVLVSIWASIIGFDPSCRQELVRDKSQAYFIQYLVSPDAHPMQGVTAAFVLAEICNNYRDGQQTCLQQGLHRSCTMILSNRIAESACQDNNASCALLKRWVCLCLFKLCEGVGWAKYVCLMEAGHTQLYSLLDDTDSTVRASAVLALGELFGASERAAEGNSAGSGGYAQTDQTEKLKITEQELALQLLENCTDGSVVVRRESLIALCKFLSLPVHNACIQMIAKELWVHDGSACPWSVPAPQAAAVVELVRVRLEEWSASLSPNNDSFSSRIYGSTDALHVQTGARERKAGDASAVASSRSLVVPSESDESLPPSSPPKSSISHHNPVPQPSAHAVMAAGYLRLWLALYEVQSKDPFPSVAKAAQTITAWVRNSVALTMDREREKERERASGNHQGAGGGESPFRVGGSYNMGIPPSPLSQRGSRGMGGGANNNPGMGFPGASSPFGGTPTGSGPFFSFGSQTNMGMMGSSLNTAGAGGGIAPAISSGSFQNLNSLSDSNGQLNSLSADTGLATVEIPDDESSLPLPLSSPFLTSHLYDWLRALFLTPSTDQNFYEDPLSIEGSNRLYRHQRLEELLAQDQSIRTQFKDLLGEEEEMRAGGDRHAREMEREGVSSKKSTATSSAATLSPAAYKFEQRSILNIENADMTSLAMFHSFLDILAVRYSSILTCLRCCIILLPHLYSLIHSDGYNVGIWNVNTGTKILSMRPTASPQQAPTTPSQPIPASPTYNISFSFSPTSGNTFANYIPVVPPPAPAITPASVLLAEKAGHIVGTTPTGSFTSPSTTSSTSIPRGSTQSGVLGGRITAMTWINESYDALLMLGSDNGTVTVWRDTAVSEAQQSGQPSVLDPDISLASSFLALPDVADTSRGSGVIMSWQQTCGSLTVGGNSGTIRIWDLGREQCVRIFATGLETCVTAIASRSVTHDAFSSGSSSSSNSTSGEKSLGGIGSLHQGALQGCRTSLSAGSGNSGNLGSTSGPVSADTVPLTWTFAGFADGSVGVFDERLPGAGRVTVAREHSAWIVSAHLRHDVPEAITGSVRGSVKFWDLRTMRTYKTLEVHKSPLTALAVHNTAPVMATGSHAQFIKILTLGGEQLGGIIKYHDGFLGQRIGPVSCLAFHPVRMMLVAGATDSIVSIYSTL